MSVPRMHDLQYPVQILIVFRQGCGFFAILIHSVDVRGRVLTE